MKKISTVLILSCLLASSLIQAQVHSRFDAHIILIPLDDRPPCLQFPTKMGLIGNVEVVSPPKNLLGSFTQSADPDKIVSWIKQQDLSHTDAIIVSLDMLVYGGLVSSRVSKITESEAAKRFEILKEIRLNNPKIRIYGSSILMRLAPTADGKNEAWREKVNKWASLPHDEKSKAEILKLEKEIPSEVLAEYKKTRARNFIVNGFALDLVKTNIVDYLILGQDDARPKGIHSTERDSLQKMVAIKNLSDKVILQAGADEASMLLLARSFTDRTSTKPQVKLIFSSAKTAAQVMPFEDKPLRETVSSHLKACGTTETTDDKAADLFFFVYASRLEKGRSATFTNEIAKIRSINPTKGIIVADIDPTGEVQGSDPDFTELALTKKIFSDCAGYAAWNTAANTIGTALPQGLIYWISKAKTDRTLQTKEEMKEAQAWFIRHRLVDDYLYHSVVRPSLIKNISEKDWNPLKLTEKQVSTLEFDGKERLEELSNQLVEKFPQGKKYGISKLSFHLPWKRTFEAEIEFQLGK